MGPEFSEVPFVIRDGWPDALPNTPVTVSEIGVLLGLWLAEADWTTLSEHHVLTLRIDDHPTEDGWTTEHPDGSVTTSAFTIPTEPVAAPPGALLNTRSFEDWVHGTHGAEGRLLVWDSSARWWIVSEPDLEAQLVCATPGMFTSLTAHESPFEWLPSVTDYGRQKIEALAGRYSLR